MEKNEIYNILIEDMTEDGSGIGHVNGMAVFVKDTAPGDEAEIKIIKAKKNYAFGRLERIIKPSEFRVEPVCPVNRPCGGCSLQHISYEQELELKKKRVLNCLERIGGIENPQKYLEGVYGMNDPDIPSGCYRYRNKMQFPVGKDKNGKTITGFYAGRTLSLIPVDDCFIGHPVNRYITKAVCRWADENGISIYDEKIHNGLLRHILTRVGFKTGELMVCLVINGKKVPHSERLVADLNEAINLYHEENETEAIRLTSVVANINMENTNKILGEKTFVIEGQDYITDYIGDIKFQISAQSFYQVNPLQTYRLYSKALEYAAPSAEDSIWDMYCGIGTISLFLSQKAGKVYGVEIVPQAIEDARLNAKLNDITNAEFFVGKAEDVVSDIYEDHPADVIVVDPPRKGCDMKLLDTICKMAPKRLVYVSCDPATLARDLKTLTEKDFRIEKLSIYDQFSRGMHVESVILMTRII